MTIRRFLSVLFALGTALLTISPTSAADPLLNRLVPQGAQRGTDVEVTFFGQRFEDGPYQVLLYEPGIEVGEIKAINGKKVSCKLTLAEQCRIGRHALRLRTASGLTNLVTFHVGNLKEIKEQEPNNTLEQPQEIAMDVVVNGVVKEGELDVFVVDLAEGERLSAEIEGIRLGRTLFDPVLEFKDQSGTLLASNDDQPAAQQDAFLSMRAERAMRVLIVVRETAFRGSDAATYRLHVGHYPRPTAVFPSAALAGQPAEVRWIGDTFDDEPVTIEVPSADQPIYSALAADEQGIAPSGVPLYLASTEPLRESEPNNGRGEANEMNAPGVACGVIDKVKDKDFYRFTMKKGEEWDFRVRARELGSPLDAVLHLFDPDGKYVKGNDDNAGHPDSYLRYKALADGVHSLDVEDRQLRGRANMTYVVEITKPTSIAELQLDERRRYRAQVINIPQGGRTAAMMTVKRKDLGGPLQVEWDDLPDGSEAEAVLLAANYHRVPVLFTAKPDAELNASLATVTARLVKKPRPIASRFRQQTWLVRGRNNVHVWSHYADRAPVAVTSALPYSVRVIEPKAPLVQGGAMELKIVAQRDEGFENPIAVRTIYNPPGVSTNQSRSIPKNGHEVLVPMTANNKARPGDWKIVFLGKTNLKGAVEASTQLVTLRVVEPYFDVKIPSLTVVQGDTVEMVVQLDHRTPFAGEAELELLRLPQGVTAQKVKVTPEGKSTAFQLVVANDARVGRHRGVACQIRMTIEGEPARYSQGYVDLCVDPSASAKAVASKQDAGRPAS